MQNRLITFLLFLFIGLFSTITPLFAENITIHFFEDRLCSTCAAQKDFMNTIKDDYPNLEIKTYLISETSKLHQLASDYNVKDYRIMAPTSFINGVFFQFNDFGERERASIIDAIEGNYIESGENIINIPFINKELDLDNLPILLTTIVLSSVDGLNVCSIGALILILSIVLAFNSRRKILFYGGIFIFTTALVYGIIVFAWGKVFEVLLGQLEILRIIVGLSALIGGAYFFKQFIKFLRSGPACESSKSTLITKATRRIKNVFENENSGILATVGAIIIFASIVVIVELPCSIGFPIVFVGILAESNLSLSAFIFYVLVYLLFYMLIEIIVFLIAVFTKKIWLSDSKAVTWATLIGSLFLFYLAFYYLF